MANGRMSMYSVASEGLGGPRAGQQPSQFSTTTLLNAIHNIYLSSQPFKLDAGTSLVVNTWLTASQTGPDGRTGGTIDAALGARAWEHARRRAEDGCIVLGHPAFLEMLHTLQPLHARQSALGVTLTLNLAGNVHGAAIALSQGGIDTAKGLLNIPAEAGYRAFDVFYYLLTSASTPAEREFLGLKSASSYALLAKSGTYDPPSYLPTADDAAAADDFRSALKDIGIKGSAHRNLISTLAGLLKLGDTLDYNLDEEVFDEICEDVSGLLGMDPETLATQCTTDDRATLVSGLYEALVDWVIAKANQAISAQMARIRDGTESIGGGGARTPTSNGDGDTVCITILDVPDPTLGKALAMRGVFDDTLGINSEMIADGVEVSSAGSTVVREMQTAIDEVGPELGIMTGAIGKDRQHALEKREEVLEKIGHSADEDAFLKKLLFPIAGQGINLGLAGRLDISSLLSSSRVWYHLSIHPTDDSPASLAALPSINSAWSAGTVSRQLRSWRLPEWANRRSKNLDFTADFDIDEFVQRYSALGCKDGREGIETWILERGWTNGEVVVGKERVWVRESAWWEAESMLDMKPLDNNLPGMGNVLAVNNLESGYSANGSGYFPTPMVDTTPNGSRDHLIAHQRNFSQGNLSQHTLAQNAAMRAPSVAPSGMRNVQTGDYGLGTKGDTYKGQVFYNNEGEFVGQMDPEIADGKHVEEKTMDKDRRIWVAIVWFWTFWIPSPLLRFVGRMKRPDVRMAWREKLTLVWFIVLINAAIVFWIIAFGRLLCPNFDKAWNAKEVGYHAGETDFYVSFRGGVYDVSKFWKTQHSDTAIETTKENMIQFAGLNMDDYFPPPLPLVCPGLGIATTTTLQYNTTPEYTIGIHKSGSLADDRTSALGATDWYSKKLLPRMKEFYKGDLVWDKGNIKSDGQDNSHMWVIYNGGVYDLTNYFKTLDVFKRVDSVKFLNTKIVSAIENNPGEDVTDNWNEIIKSAASNSTENASVQNSLNCIKNLFYVGIPDFRYSARCQTNNYIMLAMTIILCAVILIKFLAALQFGSKRRPAPQDKFVICQFEGNVVPYLVVVKCGKESEQSKSKPGNRGKRDSQILLMSFLNRVHHRAPMSPLELEMFHQINNIIGVDPELYEYLMMVDADTCVREDSLNRLVSACANDAKIAGICGETGLQNDDKSWWTMIQVYEYFISHNLAKAFESLFGSVTCLPGCFTMYRLRTVDKGKPLIIADGVIRDYAVCDVDTLHKKNLLSLGEDRYLTTLMTKYFPSMKYKFIPDAYCQTAAPESWSVLLSQRRRWINSTIHNLFELMKLKEMCGFCCFSMRFVVFIDLFGTIILPATTIYLGYMIYLAASGTGQFPIISIIMLAAVYGLQALIFILKRQWQHIGWMIIYILAFPIYSFALPIYSFWNQDNFSWGNTRIVIGEKGNKQIVAVDDEGFDPRSIPLQRWDDYAMANNLPAAVADMGYDDQYEMDEIRSVYSSVRQGSVLTGMNRNNTYMPPQSPAPFGNMARASGATSPYHHDQTMANRQSMASLGTHDINRGQTPFQDFPSSRPSVTNLRGQANLSPGLGANRSQSALGLNRPHGAAQSTSSFDFQRGNMQGPDDGMIIEAIQGVLREVDLDTVTKKQVRALVEQRLQTGLVGERRTFMDRQIDNELANM
ncbi:chitin synthase [Colletotrichum tofieldiae]|nr:chitin synthase [Colletotrichum tofieldiae]